MTQEQDPVIAFRREYVDFLGGDVPAALMLSQIYYWYQPRKDDQASKLRKFKEGHWWLAKSWAHWYEELGMKESASSRCIAVLIAKGVIAKEVFKYDGAPTVHIRLLAVHDRTGLTHPLQVFDLSSPQFASVKIAKSLTETTAEITGTSVPVQKPPVANAVVSGKFTKGKLVTAKAQEPTPATPSEAVMKPSTSVTEALGQVSSKGSLSEKLAVIWKYRLHLKTGKYVKELTGKDMALLKRWGKRVAELGHEAPGLLLLILDYWDIYAFEVKMAKGITTAPLQPTTGFLVEHYEIACQLRQRLATKAAEDAAKMSPKTDNDMASSPTPLPPMPVVGFDKGGPPSHNPSPPDASAPAATPAEVEDILKNSGFGINLG